MLESLAYVIERDATKLYEWTDEQFDIWFNRDALFVGRVCTRGNGETCTQKENVFHEVRLMLKKLREPTGFMIDRARAMLEERQPDGNLTPELVWETMIDAIFEEHEWMKQSIDNTP